MKKLWKSDNSEVMAKSLVSCFFWLAVYIQSRQFYEYIIALMPCFGVMTIIIIVIIDVATAALLLLF